MEGEPVAIAPVWGWGLSQGVMEDCSGKETGSLLKEDDDLPTEIAYKDHPGFGKF